MNYDCALVILIILIYFSTFKYNCSTFCVRLARIDTLHISMPLVIWSCQPQLYRAPIML